MATKRIEYKPLSGVATYEVTNISRIKPNSLLSNFLHDGFSDGPKVNPIGRTVDIIKVENPEYANYHRHSGKVGWLICITGLGCIFTRFAHKLGLEEVENVIPVTFAEFNSACWGNWKTDDDMLLKID